MDKSHEEYVACFRSAPGQEGKGDYQSDTRLAKAYDVALDIRKFEIDLYWKRSNSFWLIVAALGALLIGALSAKDLDGNLKSLVVFTICVFAAVVAYAWSLVNKAGKFWQRNWEYQVDVLEDAIVGPLYKTVFSKLEPEKEQLYSVTKVNLALSRFVMLAFFACVSTPTE
ncbi:RipA family octameric membrane protein, partial [Ralstonia solanacearum]